MTELDQYIEELFALPINTYEAATVDGAKLFSSNKLKANYLRAMAKLQRTSPISDNLQKLVETGKVLPVWMNKGVGSLTLFKIFAPTGIKMIRGFYTPEHKTIILLIDNMISWGFASNSALGDLTLHEGMHMYADVKKTTFLSLFKNELIKYYYVLFNEMFKLKNTKVDVSPIIKFIFKYYELPELNSSRMIKQIPKYKDLLDKTFRPYTSLKQDEFTKYLNDFENALTFFFKDFNTFVQNRRSYVHILTPMYKAYKKAFGARNLSTLCIQELVFPSEVIAILTSIKPSPKIYKAFSQLS